MQQNFRALVTTAELVCDEGATISQANIELRYSAVRASECREASAECWAGDSESGAFRACGESA